ncbi:MAG: TIGR02206 family membrane protein [Bacteroidota bacterium]
MYLFISTLLFQSRFVSYGNEHLSWLLYGTLSTVFWIWYGRRQPDDPGKQRVGLIMSLFPATLWACISVYLIAYTDPVDLNLVLPFHVCYFINLMMPVLMWRRSYFLFEIFYFVVMAGCIQALLTPDVSTVFPDHIHIRYFVVHISLVQSVLYAIFVFRFRPTWKGLGKTLVWMNVYFVFVLMINLLLDTNFMFLRRKPGSASLLDHLGDWPWYILVSEFVAVILFAVVMLPFAFGGKGNSRANLDEDKEKERKQRESLLIEMMRADEESGIYEK